MTLVILHLWGRLPYLLPVLDCWRFFGLALAQQLCPSLAVASRQRWCSRSWSMLLAKLSGKNLIQLWTSKDQLLFPGMDFVPSTDHAWGRWPHPSPPKHVTSRHAGSAARLGVGATTGALCNAHHCCVPWNGKHPVGIGASLQIFSTNWFWPFKNITNKLLDDIFRLSTNLFWPKKPFKKSQLRQRRLPQLLRFNLNQDSRWAFEVITTKPTLIFCLPAIDGFWDQCFTMIKPTGDDAVYPVHMKHSCSSSTIAIKPIGCLLLVANYQHSFPKPGCASNYHQTKHNVTSKKDLAVLFWNLSKEFNHLYWIKYWNIFETRFKHLFLTHANTIKTTDSNHLEVVFICSSCLWPPKNTRPLWSTWCYAWPSMSPPWVDGALGRPNHHSWSTLLQQVVVVQQYVQQSKINKNGCSTKNMGFINKNVFIYNCYRTWKSTKSSDK